MIDARHIHENEMNLRHKTPMFLVGAMLLASLAACASADELQDPPMVKTVPTPGVDAAAMSSVTLHPSIGLLCNISAPHAYFEYDSTELSWSDDKLVDQLTECLQSGALKGQTLRLIGRTDPRGSKDYNKDLGMERAQSIANALIKKGIDGDRFKVLSRGESGVSPNGSERDYASQRRVDIQLADRKQYKVTMVYWDSNENGVIESNEFYTFMTGMYDHDAWDADKSGWLNQEEVSLGMQKLWDADFNGSISEEEFKQGTTSWYRDREVFSEFSAWDIDKDGALNDAEWRAGFAGRGVYIVWDKDKDSMLFEDEFSSAIYGYWDANKDNVIDADELNAYNSGLYWIEDGK